LVLHKSHLDNPGVGPRPPCGRLVINYMSYSMTRNTV
jgi:hypothetical protein